MFHPGIELKKLLQEKKLTQKVVANLCGKNTSELNELLKGKRNFTIQRDIILHKVLGTPEKFWVSKQVAYEYAIAKQIFDTSNLTAYGEVQKEEGEVKSQRTNSGDKMIEKQNHSYDVEKIVDDDILVGEEIVLSDEKIAHHKVFDKF